MQRVANKPVKLSVIIVSVVMLNVLAQCQAGAAFKPLIFCISSRVLYPLRHCRWPCQFKNAAMNENPKCHENSLLAFVFFWRVALHVRFNCAFLHISLPLLPQNALDYDFTLSRIFRVESFNATLNRTCKWPFSNNFQFGKGMAFNNKYVARLV
jgi:hypothetical protein